MANPTKREYRQAFNQQAAFRANLKGDFFNCLDCKGSHSHQAVLIEGNEHAWYFACPDCGGVCDWNIGD